MTNKLYTSKNGTPHVVRALETVREFTKGEKMENTATTEQVLLQRQKQESIARWTFYVDDLSYPKFTMQLETFLEEYKEIDSPEQENFGEMLQNIFRDKTPNEVPDKIKTNIKMRVTPEQSVKVQEIVFKNGGGWNTTGRRYTSFIDAPFLYLSEKRQLMLGTEEASFYEEPEIEVDADLFIRTNGTCEEGQLCSTEELKIIKEVLQDMEAPQEEQANQVRKYNIGSSDYAKRKIQPWDIWLEYELNPWDADIVKRVLRNKQGQSRIEEYQKIIHICEERIRQIGANNG